MVAADIDTKQRCGVLIDVELICNLVYVLLVDDSAESGENEMSDASVTAEFTVGERVRVFPGSSDERSGVLVEDFGQDAGYAIDVGNSHIADASRRWAVTLDDGSLVFVDSSDIVVDVDAGELPLKPDRPVLHVGWPHYKTSATNAGSRRANQPTPPA